MSSEIRPTGASPLLADSAAAATAAPPATSAADATLAAAATPGTPATPPTPATIAAYREPGSGTPAWDLVCLSHLRWDFVYQRPQHLMSRFGGRGRVLFVEEPIADAPEPRIELRDCAPGVTGVVPHLPPGCRGEAAERLQEELLGRLLSALGVSDFVLWYYTPMALGFTRRLEPLATVYDCMDELLLFKDAPPELLRREAELLERADVVFTGGASLYEAKQRLHDCVFAFPSSIDAAHFRRARAPLGEPPDQAAIPRPRLGYFGVIDERIDLPLLAAVAERRPDWHLCLVGPVAKIDPAMLPRRANVHHLGMKRYDELPAYLAGWQAALMPFALNDATRFISPTKTPEYLAGGRPVVSTPVRDVERVYGTLGLVEIAEGPDAFIAAVERVLAAGADPARRQDWLARVDDHLAGLSWDRTFGEMRERIEAVVETRRAARVLWACG
jgi:glycosyltransferase involved in cell wall biosynthesis